MNWKEVPAPARKADYAGKLLLLLETPPKQRHKYDDRPELPILGGDVARIWMRRSFKDATCMDVDISSWAEGRVLELRWKCPYCAALHPVLAPAVATQEATDGDSSTLPRQAFNAVTVAIRKQAAPANGYRIPESWIAERKALFVEQAEGEQS